MNVYILSTQNCSIYAYNAMQYVYNAVKYLQHTHTHIHIINKCNMMMHTHTHDLVRTHMIQYNIYSIYNIIQKQFTTI